MTIREILLFCMLLYFSIGIIVWFLGVSNMGGKEKYVEYLTKELGMHPNTYYVAFVVFVVCWPTFIKKGE